MFYENSAPPTPFLLSLLYKTFLFQRVQLLLVTNLTKFVFPMIFENVNFGKNLKCRLLTFYLNRISNISEKSFSDIFFHNRNLIFSPNLIQKRAFQNNHHAIMRYKLYHIRLIPKLRIVTTFQNSTRK